MTDSQPKPKLRWWQFSLRKFILLTTLFTVLAVAFWRVRERGRELHEKRTEMLVTVIDDSRLAPILFEQKDREVAAFDKKYWLPLMVYEWTSRPPEPKQLQGNQSLQKVSGGMTFRSGRLVPQAEQSDSNK